VLTWPCPICEESGIVASRNPGHRVAVMPCRACGQRGNVPLRWFLRWWASDRLGRMADRTMSAPRVSDAWESAADRVYPGPVAWP
jgi:hypothetical protein